MRVEKFKTVAEFLQAIPARETVELQADLVELADAPKPNAFTNEIIRQVHQELYRRAERG